MEKTERVPSPRRQEHLDEVRNARNERQRKYLEALRRQREWKEQQAATAPLFAADESAQERYRKHAQGLTGTNPLPAESSE